MGWFLMKKTIKIKLKYKTFYKKNITGIHKTNAFFIVDYIEDGKNCRVGFLNEYIKKIVILKKYRSEKRYNKKIKK